MQAFPHHYSIAARAAPQGDVALEGDRLPAISSAPPTEFGGPGDVSGTVDRVERVTQFTELAIRARLRVPAGAKEDQARRLLTRAEETCLVTNSLKVQPRLECVVELGAS